MLDDALTDQQLGAMPLFPLPGAVFFPGAVLPLHVFEPRYRALTEHCIHKQWPMAVPMIAPGEEAAQLGAPTVCQVMGVGKVQHWQRMDDGRYAIILEGIARAKLEKELNAGTPFRVARVSLLPDKPAPEAVAVERMHTIRECLALLGRRIPKLTEALLGALSGTQDPALATNQLAAVLFRRPEQRQAMLERVGVAERLDAVVARLSALAAGTAQADDGLVN